MRLARLLGTAGLLAAFRELVPLPLLGVPGWCEDNLREDYYGNIDYFRPRRHP